MGPAHGSSSVLCDTQRRRSLPNHFGGSRVCATVSPRGGSDLRSQILPDDATKYGAAPTPFSPGRGAPA
jgi:hypothetical protein